MGRHTLASSCAPPKVHGEGSRLKLGRPTREEMRVKLPAWARTPRAGATTGAWLWVLVGALAVVTLIGGLTADLHGFLEVRASWWRPLITLPATLVLSLAWWQLGPRWKHPLVTAALWCLPMMFAMPMHSRDSYAYAATGWQVAAGIDPYLTPLGQAGDAGLLVGVHWIKTTSVYPSLSLDIFGLVSRLTGGDPYWTTVALRLPSVLALLILALVLPRLARRFGLDPRLVLWAGLLNPIMLIQWVGGVHNDALMVALGAAAFLAVTDLGWKGWRGLVVAGVLLGIAMGVKQSAALFGLGVVAVAWALRIRRGGGWPRLIAQAGVAGAVTIATFLVSSWSWGLGWRNPTAGSPIEVTSNAPLSWIASFLRYHHVFSFPVANSVVTVLSTLLIIALIVAVWVKFGPRGSGIGRPWTFSVAVLTVFMVVGPALQPWYLTWVIPFYAFMRGTARLNRIWLTVIVAFALLPTLQDVLPAYVSMAVVGVPLWVGWRVLGRRGCDPLPMSDQGADPFETAV